MLRTTSLRSTSQLLTLGILSRFDIGSSGQQVHISCGPTDPKHSRHPCFKLPGRDELEAIKKSIYDHHIRGGPAAPMAADKPGAEASGRRSHLGVPELVLAGGRWCRNIQSNVDVGRCEREGVSPAVLCTRLCREQTGIYHVGFREVSGEIMNNNARRNDGSKNNKVLSLRRISSEIPICRPYGPHV